MYQRNIIKQWIRDGEGPQLDFKLSITSPPKIARTIVSFANSRGGKIVVGIEDHGHIVGINPPEEMFELDKAANSHCDPPIELEYDECEAYGKTLLIVYVKESDQKPHFVIDKKGKRKMYVRIADKSVVPVDLIKEMLVKGDMNHLQRNFAYTKLKMELIEYLKKQQCISIDEYMRWKNCSERSAKRALLDFLFEGVLKPVKQDDFELFELG